MESEGFKMIELCIIVGYANYLLKAYVLVVEYLVGLCGQGFDLKGYSDSYYARCNIDKKSTSGVCQFLGSKLVCWSAKKLQSITMSSTEVEYVAAISLYQGHIMKGDIELYFIPTEYQLADRFTKPLNKPTFTWFKAELRMLNIDDESLTNNVQGVSIPQVPNKPFRTPLYT
ncbi:Copia protein [Artemisia annua]|uniref:Copia protein n=1 Tax=Artemisia annua TaxID=35608 RepID=A0A2U1MMU2_ARTAN|nr:Copia protein [Artemisia annua]